MVEGGVMNGLAIEPTRHRLDVDAFVRMHEAGVFDDDARIELIEGELFDMAPIGPGHAGVAIGMNEALVLACAGRASVSPQGAVRLSPLSLPQPDFAVLRIRSDSYVRSHPTPGDVLLLVEVSDSSLRFDSTVKLSLYARSGIGEYWIVDLKRRAVDVYRRPLGDAYAERITYGAGDKVALALAPEIVVTLDLVFG